MERTALKQFKRGVSTEKVELYSEGDALHVLKVFKTTNKQVREHTAYLLLEACPFVPNVVRSSVEEKSLTTEYVGESLNIKYPPTERKRFIPRIQEMNRILIEEYGIHHNDIRWKNVVESPNGDLFLIDFESWTSVSQGNRERDPERILHS